MRITFVLRPDNTVELEYDVDAMDHQALAAHGFSQWQFMVNRFLSPVPAGRYEEGQGNGDERVSTGPTQSIGGAEESSIRTRHGADAAGEGG